MEEINYWIWISRLKNVKQSTLIQILENGITPKELYYMTQNQLKQKKVNQIDILEILKPEYKENIEKLKKYMEKNDIEIITINSKDYPIKLKEIYDPPIVIYVKGNKKILNEKSIAIVRL